MRRDEIEAEARTISNALLSLEDALSTLAIDAQERNLMALDIVAAKLPRAAADVRKVRELLDRQARERMAEAHAFAVAMRLR